MDKITQILENVVRCKYFEAGVHIKNPIKNSYQDGLGRPTQTLHHVVVVHILIWNKRKSQINEYNDHVVVTSNSAYMFDRKLWHSSLSKCKISQRRSVLSYNIGVDWLDRSCKSSDIHIYELFFLLHLKTKNKGFGLHTGREWKLRHACVNKQSTERRNNVFKRASTLRLYKNIWVSTLALSDALRARPHVRSPGVDSSLET